VFALLTLCTELGFRLGVRGQSSLSELAQGQISNMQSALFGLLALLLGFTFAMSISRFDTRKELIVKEANAIGTAALRTELLPSADSVEMRVLFRRYVELRIRAGRTHDISSPEHVQLDAHATRLQRDIWRRVVTASAADPHSVAMGLLVSATNDLIDVKGERDAWLANHVPETVLFLLFAFSGVASGILGFSNGLAGTRITGMAAAFAILVTLVLMLILDLDRPQRGLILVSDESMVALERSLADSK